MLMKTNDKFQQKRIQTILTLYFDTVIKNNEQNISYMSYFVNQIIKMMSTIPGVAQFIKENQQYFQKLYDWVTDNPNPKQDKYYNFYGAAAQRFNLIQLKKLREGQDLSEPDAWDSDEEICNFKFYEGEDIDINIDRAFNWTTAKVTRTLDEMIEIKFDSYQGSQNNWQNITQHTYKLAPHLKMQNRFDIREIH